MTGGLCWQGGGEEIRGAVRNLLREGQLRTEQRASERGEFPCSGSAESASPRLRQSLWGSWLVWEYQDCFWLVASVTDGREVQMLISSQWFAAPILDVSSSPCLWLMAGFISGAEMKSHICEVLLLQIGASHWRPVFCFVWFIYLNLGSWCCRDCTCSCFICSQTSSKGFFQPLKLSSHPDKHLEFYSSPFDPRQCCDALTAAAFVVTERQTGWS